MYVLLVHTVEDVKKHLDLLEELFQTSKQPKPHFGQLWSKFLNRRIKFIVFLEHSATASDPSHISQLAFVQQHPRISRDPLFLQKPKSETLQSEIVAAGYNQRYVNAEGIVVPILETLQDYAGAWLPATH
ncbi:hypothetical protein VP01_3816g1, partial [Puccinia sorghi]